jgi:hypothetical protein
LHGKVGQALSPANVLSRQHPQNGYYFFFSSA